MPENETIIHIGMPKCASTTLQNNFFSKLPMINYAGVNGEYELSKLTNSIFQMDDLYFNESQLKKEILSKINPTKTFVISEERNSGVTSPYSPIFTQSRVTIAQRYKSLFPKAKIIIIIRNQLPFQKSAFVQGCLNSNKYFRKDRMPFKEWIDLNIKQYKNGWVSVLELADYFPLVKYYFENFNSVKIVIFEEMIKDISGFLKNELCPYIGIDGEEAIKYYIDEVANKRHTKAEIILNKYIHRGIAFLQNKLGNPQKAISEEKREAFRKKLYSFTNSIKLGKIKTEYTEEQKQFLLDYYGENNRKLSEMIGVDLGKYGYPIK